jgi:Tfp pilus assembly protein PilV
MRSRGLTVIETMVAVTLFAVAVIAVIGIYPASVRASRQAHGQLVAANLAEKELEFSRAMEYDGLDTRQKDYLLTLETNGAPTTVEFETETQVSEIREGLKRVAVTVRWQGTDLMNRRLEMETYVARLTP